MYRNEYTAKIGFTRVLDRTCLKDGGLYSSNEKSHCPKCNQPLVPPTRQSESGPIPYCFTEVTLYPLMRKETRERHAKRTEAAKGLLYTLRMVLWGHMDKETGVAVPDNRTQYLVPKRTIRVEFNNPPQLLPYTASDKSTKVEMKYTFDARDGDQIEFLDAKQTSATMLVEANPAPAANPAPNPQDTAGLLAQLTSLTQALQANGVLPAPNPAEASMSMDQPEDYQPSEDVRAEEESLDPFSA